VEVNNSPNTENQRVTHDAKVGRPNRSLYHQNVYLGLLIFVLVAGLPMVGLPSLRSQLRTRVRTLRAAITGEPLLQAPSKVIVGENQEPFPKEYERAQAQERPSYLPKIDTQARSPYRIIIGGQEGNLPAKETAAPAPKGRLVIPPVSVPSGGATNAGESQAGAASTDSRYRKGKSEQEAYDLLLSANTTLAGMVKGSDPALKFQDWAAADMGQDSYYVMLTFIQTLDDVVRKYIWNVKVATKEIVPLSAYAREITK
jgi:hypothetical protein